MSLHAHLLDPYHHGDSWVHRADARVKLILAVLFILISALTPTGIWAVYLLLLSLVWAAVLVSGLGIRFLLKRSLLALPFVLAALPLLVSVDGRPLAVVSLGPVTLTISQAGLQRFASVVLRSWISVQAAILLAATTPFPQLLVAMRALRIPRLLVAIVGLMWRYLFVIADEAVRLMRARAARSGHPEQADTRVGGSLAWRARVTGGMAGNLLLRSFDRSDRIYQAMLARGYDGEVRTLPSPPITPVDRWTLVLGTTLLLALLALGLVLSR